MSQYVEVKTAELTGSALDLVVAQTVGGRGWLRSHKKSGYYCRHVAFVGGSA